MTFEQWVKTYLGKKTDYDGTYGVQCVDLAKCFIEKVLGVKPQSIGDAKEYWNKRANLKYLKDNFTFVKCNYKNGELQAGDIGVRTSGKHGHIFIIAEPTANGKIKFYDQNASGKGDPMTLRTKAYTSMVITGVLRPKNQKNLPKKTAVNKSNTPKYEKNKTYTLQTDVKVRKGPSEMFNQKLRSSLTDDGKKHSKVQLMATLKKGTEITVKSIKTDANDNIWLEIPSGWVCAYLKKEKRTLIK